jgi:diacylglycerol kinase (ATP)
LGGIYNGELAQIRYRNAFLIYNPRAGKLHRHHGQLLQRIIGQLEQCGHQVTAIPTTGPNTAAGLAREALSKNADAILVAGGDGTINEAINGMIGSRVPVGIIPVGTANVLGCELRIKGGAVGAARALGTWVPRQVAAGRLQNEANPDGRYFLAMAGIGLDAKIVYEVRAELKQRFGKAAYWLAGFGQLGRRFPEFDARVNDRPVTCSFALASRVKNYGGDLEIATGASLLEDQFEAVLFEGRQSWVFMRYLLGVLSKRLGGMKGVTVARVREMDFAAARDPRIYVQVDGEFAGRLPAIVSIEPGALTLLVPPGFVSQNG